jgi:hypothetical protein
LWRAAFPLVAGLAMIAAPDTGRAREWPVRLAAEPCWLRNGTGEQLEVGVQLNTVSGFWGFGAPADGRWHPIGSAERAGPSASWSARDPVAHGLTRKLGSNLAYLDGRTGEIRIEQIEGSVNQLGTARKMRLQIRDLVMEDGFRLPSLVVPSMTCDYPHPP